MQSRVIIGAGVVVAAAVGVTVFAVTADGDGPKRNQPRTAQAAGTSTGQDIVRFDHPAAWTREANTADDTKAGILIKLKRADPEGSFILRRIVGRLEQPLDLAKLGVDTQAALATEIEGFTPLENKTVRISGRNVLRISYQQNLVPTPYRAVLVVAPTTTRTYYLTFRAPAGAFPALEAEVDLITTNVLGAIRP